MNEQRQTYLSQLRHYFDVKADEYISGCYDGVGRYPSNMYRTKIILSLIQQQFPDRRNQTRLLDLGCGAGQLLVDLLKLGYDVEGVDMSDEMIVLSRKRLCEAGFSEERVRQAEIFDFFEGNFSRRQYDGIIMAGVLGYLPDLASVLDKVREFVKPQTGVLVCDVNNRLFDLFTLNRYSVRFYHWILSQAGLSPQVQTSLQEKIEALLKLDDIKPVRPKTFQPLETGPRRYFPEEDYDWNPLNYHLKFREVGFEVLTKRYFHYHPFPTRFEADFPDLLTEAGQALETVEENWLGGILCSGCVILAKRGE